MVLALSGIVISRFFLRDEQSAFIMEMPLYHVPNARTIGTLVWHRLTAFLQKAGTVILVVSVVVWALSALPSGDIETSYLAAIGRLLAPIGALMGLDWRALLALLTSFVAKENAIATLGVLYGAATGATSLAQVLASQIAPASGLAFLVAQMLFIPCASTLIVIRQESGSWRWALLDAAFLSVLTLAAGTAAYHLAVWLI